MDWYHDDITVYPLAARAIRAAQRLLKNIRESNPAATIYTTRKTTIYIFF